MRTQYTCCVYIYMHVCIAYLCVVLAERPLDHLGHAQIARPEQLQDHRVGQSMSIVGIQSIQMSLVHIITYKEDWRAVYTRTQCCRSDILYTCMYYC